MPIFFLLKDVIKGQMQTSRVFIGNAIDHMTYSSHFKKNHKSLLDQILKNKFETAL